MSTGIRPTIRLTCLTAMCVSDRIGKLLILQFRVLKQSATSSCRPQPPPPSHTHTTIYVSSTSQLEFSAFKVI